MNTTNIELHMNYLFSAALKKCGNFQDAEDLTSEVLLAALNYSKEIKDIKSWLSGVLNHKYYDMLRKKYKQPTVSINLVDEAKHSDCRLRKTGNLRGNFHFVPTVANGLPLEARIAEFRKYRHNQIPMALIKEAVAKGAFCLEKHTPPMVLVIED